jgi:serine phosphatase RsbU (regulator of sigma subunit)
VTSASLLLDHAPEILRRWDRRVRAEIPASRQQQKLVLQNNLEPLLREVARALCPTGEPEARIAGLTLSQDHGGHRARLAEYSIAEMFLEYRLLRQTTLEVLDEVQLLSSAEREVINNSLERAMQDAVSQFAEVHRDVERARADAAHRVAEELREAYDRERRISEVLQRPLLLQVSEDAFPGLSIATWYEPALAEAEVGGDFYDVFSLPDGSVALVVADTCGKGLEAAAHNTQVKDVLRAFLREEPAWPELALSRLNDVVCDTLESGPASLYDRFVVLSIAVLDARTGQARFASSGAEPPLVVRADGQAQPVECRGMALGVQPGEIYEPVRLHLAPKDTVVMVTDGVTEARTDERLLGYEGMARLAGEALKLRTKSLSEGARAIVEGARAFGGGSFRDDVCLILARRR